MNLGQIKTAIRNAYDLGGADGSKPAKSEQVKARTKFLNSLRDLESPKLTWQEAERISDVDEVDDALRDFTDDPTADAATILVQRIVAAYLKGP